MIPANERLIHPITFVLDKYSGAPLVYVSSPSDTKTEARLLGTQYNHHTPNRDLACGDDGKPVIYVRHRGGDFTVLGWVERTSTGRVRRVVHNYPGEQTRLVSDVRSLYNTYDDGWL